jgi:hypothetical protein
VEETCVADAVEQMDDLDRTHMAAETDAGEETAIDESLGYTNLAPSPNPLRTYHLFLYLYLYQDAQPYHL